MFEIVYLKKNHRQPLDISSGAAQSTTPTTGYIITLQHLNELHIDTNIYKMDIIIIYIYYFRAVGEDAALFCFRLYPYDRV